MMNLDQTHKYPLITAKALGDAHICSAGQGAEFGLAHRQNGPQIVIPDGLQGRSGTQGIGE
jgi:hypothetical protein